MKRMLVCSLLVVLSAGAFLGAVGQTQATSAPVAGIWTVTMVGRSQPIRLELKTDGSTVTGSFDGSTVVGELKDGQLTFADATSWAEWRAGTIGRDDAPVMYPTIVVAKLGANGTLSGWTDVYIRGYGPQAIKRLSWTAVRSTGK